MNRGERRAFIIKTKDKSKKTKVKKSVERFTKTKDKSKKTKV